MSFKTGKPVVFSIYIIFRVTRLVRDSARKRNERYPYRLCPTLQVRAVYTLWKGTGLPLLPFMRCWIYCWSVNLKLEKSHLLSQDCIAAKLYWDNRNGFGHVMALSIRIPFGQNKTQKELQSYTAARGFLNSHKKIDLSFNYTPEEWEGKLEWLQLSLHMRNEKRKLKSELFEVPEASIFTGAKCSITIQLNDQNWTVRVICKSFAFLRVLCTVLHSWFVFIFCWTNKRIRTIYFQFKLANVSFKSVFKRLIQTTTNTFTETLKFISTSKGFSSCFEKLALSSEQNLKYFSEHGQT